jgi:hypothetical protein
MTRSHVLAGLLFIAALSCSKSCSCSRGSSAYAGRALASVTNGTKQDAVVFVAFGADSAVVASDWVSFCHATSILNCNFPIQSNSSTTLPLSGKYLNATFSFNGQGCDATKAELNINNSKWYDIADISLVDGYSNEVEVAVSLPEIDAKKETLLGPPHGKDNNEKVFGLFPLGCDICTARQKPPCGFVPGGTGCKSGTQYKPDVPCQYQGSVMGGSGSYDVRLVQLVPATL